MKVIVTGASGVLGSAIFDALRKTDHDTIGLANTRARQDFLQLDLTNREIIPKVFKEIKPDWVIHCAAERRPDVAEKDPVAAQKLNADLPGFLARLAKDLTYTLVYISTDYVFDGSSPPYEPVSPTNPLQFYGKSKRDGEIAVFAVEAAKTVILRVPILYGPAPRNSDSAVNILLDVVQDQSGKQYKMDHFATRYPTNVLDVASFLVRAIDQRKELPRILHYSADEPFTKYEMCLIFAKILGLPHSHIIPETDPPTGASAATRPRDCRLSTKATEELGIEGGLGLSLFEEWWTDYLKAKK